MPTHYHQTVLQIMQLHADTVARWHERGLDNPYEVASESTGVASAEVAAANDSKRLWLLTDRMLEIICRQHQFNYLLWHEEDVARSPDVSDRRIATVKRSIDRYNQQRNDTIEKIDEALRRQLLEQQIDLVPGVRLNTETPGSAIDRLSILSLRLYHLEEQLQRADVSELHLASVRGKLEIGQQQRADLSCSLAELLEDIFTGRKLLKRYRQMKMYNDPTLNPYLYDPKYRRAS
ncbi:MAG: DUF4254 domain-containing protein [Pirellulales bacterium]